MLDARAIFRLLIENEQPENPVPPDDPAQLGLDFNPDISDPKSEVMRYAEQPFRIPGSAPTDTYQYLLNKLGNRDRRKLTGRSTYLLKHEDGTVTVRYHDTDVITAHPDGKIVIDTGGFMPGGRNQWQGWRAPAGTTTRDRINSYIHTGWRIYQQKGEWYWYNHGTHYGMWDSGIKLPYSDGDTIFPDGSLQLKEHPVEIKQRRKRS